MSAESIAASSKSWVRSSTSASGAADGSGAAGAGPSSVSWSASSWSSAARLARSPQSASAGASSRGASSQRVSSAGVSSRGAGGVSSSRASASSAARSSAAWLSAGARSVGTDGASSWKDDRWPKVDGKGSLPPWPPPSAWPLVGAVVGGAVVAVDAGVGDRAPRGVDAFHRDVVVLDLVGRDAGPPGPGEAHPRLRTVVRGGHGVAQRARAAGGLVHLLVARQAVGA